MPLKVRKKKQVATPMPRPDKITRQNVQREIDAEEARKRVKKQYPDVPVIIVSAVTAETGMNFSPETDSDHNWMKADLFMEKNVRADQLHREINKLLKV